MSDLQKRLREVQSIRRDSTPLSVAVALCSEAADALDAQAQEIAALRARLADISAVVSAHCADLDRCVDLFDSHGMADTARETETAAKELRAAIDAARGGA